MSGQSRMFLKLAKFLLPSSAETILGDLTEQATQRDLWLRDVATAITAAWFSYLRRVLHEDWIGPVPSYAGASDDRLRRRAAQLRRSQRRGIALWLWAMLVNPAQNLLDIRGGYSLLPGLVAAVLVWVLMLDRDHTERQKAPQDQYRHAITHRGFTAFLPFWVWFLSTMVVRRLMSPDWGVWAVLAGAFLAVALTILRIVRLHEERSRFRQPRDV